MANKAPDDGLNDIVIIWFRSPRIMDSERLTFFLDLVLMMIRRIRENLLMYQVFSKR